MKTIKPYRLHRFYEGIPNQYVVAVPEGATYLGIYLGTTNPLSYFGEMEETVYFANFIVNNAVVTTMSADSQDQKKPAVTLEQRFFYIFGEHDEIAPEVLEKLTLLDKISIERSQLYIFEVPHTEPKDEYELSPLTKNFLARIERVEETIKADRERIIENFFGSAGLYQDFADKGSEEMIESAINKIAEDFAKAKEFITEEDQKRIKDKLPIIKTPVIEDVTEDNLKEAVKAFGEWADNLNKQHLDYVREYWRKRATPVDAPLTFQNLVTIIRALFRAKETTEHGTRKRSNKKVVEHTGGEFS